MRRRLTAAQRDRAGSTIFRKSHETDTQNPLASTTHEKSPCLLQQLSRPQSPILIREAFRILAGPADTSAPLVVLRVTEPPLAAGDFASPQERADGIEGCANVWVYCVAVTRLDCTNVQFGVKRSNRSVGLVCLLSSPLRGRLCDVGKPCGILGLR